MLKQRSTRVLERRYRNERGYVLIWMTALAIAVLGATGLAVDMGRLFIAKNETQVFVDSAALAAVLELDGTADGLARARAAVTNSGNSWNLHSEAISGAVVEFSTTQNGPWEANPSPATGYGFARVSVNVTDPLYFLPVVVNVFNQNVNSRAVAGQVDISSFPGRGMSPYTAIVQETGPGVENFGLHMGETYTIQWPQFNSNRQGCDPLSPGNCFLSPPCTNDSDTAEWSVVDNWASDKSGYWGFNNSAEIRAATLDLIQTQPIAVGDNIFPILANGQKQTQARALDDRASLDDDQSAWPAYSGSGMRIIGAPIVEPISDTETIVRGFGAFLLLSDGDDPTTYYRDNTHGNDPFCAVYLGEYVMGANNPGAGNGGTGAYRARLLQ